MAQNESLSLTQPTTASLLQLPAEQQSEGVGQVPQLASRVSPAQTVSHSVLQQKLSVAHTHA